MAKMGRPRNPKRNPVTHRTPEQQKKHDATYGKKPSEMKKDRDRHKARYAMEKAGAVKKGDGKQVDHKKPLRSGGSNARSNLHVVSASKNAGWRKRSRKA